MVAGDRGGVPGADQADGHVVQKGRAERPRAFARNADRGHELVMFRRQPNHDPDDPWRDRAGAPKRSALTVEVVPANRVRRLAKALALPVKITNRSTDFFEIMIDVEVADVKHLTTIIAALRATPVINSVERARG